MTTDIKRMSFEQLVKDLVKACSLAAIVSDRVARDKYNLRAKALQDELLNRGPAREPPTK
jgi:hypothetical protein